MQNYNLKILTNTNEAKKFVNFWKGVIEKHNDMEQYESLKRKDPTQLSDLEEILKWKNGGKLSESHGKYIKALLREWERWNKSTSKSLNKGKQFVNFMKSRGKLGVFDLFLLNLQAPKDYPIVGRHAYRAYCAINGIQDPKLSSSSKKFLEQYGKRIKVFDKGC